MKRGASLALIMLMGSAILAQKGGGSESAQPNQANTYDILRNGFINPPASARPKVYWWWLNGNVDTVRLKEELLAMKSAGVSGADIFEIGVPASDKMIPPGPAFMGPDFLKALKFAVREAGKLNIDLGFNVASSWNAGGAWTLPKHAAKSLYVSKVPATGGAQIRINLPLPEISKVDRAGKQLIPISDGKPVYYEEVTVLAIPRNIEKNTLDTTRIINLSKFFDARTSMLDCRLPAGEWEIHRYVCSNSGEPLMLPSANSHGPIIDHFDSAATEAHFMHIINTLKSVLGNDLTKTPLKSLYLASYEARGSVWTASLPDEFKRRNGYDIYKLIPGIFNQDLFDQETYGMIQSEFRKILSELMIHNFYRKAREIANRHGLKINSEAGGPGPPLHNVPAEPLKALGSLDIPRGEFWLNAARYNRDSINLLHVVKEVSSAAHIYGRKIVEEEAFTNREHWQLGPLELKPLADRAFCEGMNRVVVHGFSHGPTGSGVPGYVYHAGLHYNDRTVWWPKVKPFNDYLGRVSYILQEADFFSDVLFYYGDKLPIVVGPKNAKYRVGPGYEYEMINTEILVKDLTVQNGKLVLPGGQKFSVLALASENEINRDVLIKLQQLAKQGGIIAGAKPDKITGGRFRTDDAKRGSEIINELWTNADASVELKNLGKGRIISRSSSMDILQALGIPPDFEFVDNKLSVMRYDKLPPLDFVHYHKQDVHFYLVRNTTNSWISRNCTFRQSGSTPELWDPVSGDVTPVTIYNQREGRTELPVVLPPYGSVFVVFKPGVDNSHFLAISSSGPHPPLMEFTRDGILLLDEGTFELKTSGRSERVANAPKVNQLTGSWSVSFPKGWGAPESATFADLKSWSESETPGIKYFSGTATYSKTFSVGDRITKAQRVFLDFGKVSKVGEVWLNDTPLGITWTEPHRFDVTNVIKRGNNVLRIEVANNWSNRLTGDAITGEKYTNTNLQGLRRMPWAKVPLLESGLLGPVTIHTLNLFKSNGDGD